jgi:phosphomannomutase
VLASKADVALGFDGDGDRCGVVDNEGEEIFADKVGVMLARDMSAQHKGAVFVADVKSTGLFATDPVLIKNGARSDYWKTGHSYMKRRVNEIGALAGFEKSGSQSAKEHGRSEKRAAENLVVADHVAALRRRDQILNRRRRRENIRARGQERRQSRRPADPRSRDRQRRTRHR